MKLRPYQERAVDAILSELRGSAKSTLAVLSTGLGKTVLFAHVAKEWDRGRVLVIAHREELIFQARDKVSRVLGEEPSIEMGVMCEGGDSMFGGTSKVLISSVQTQNAGRKCDKCDGKKCVTADWMDKPCENCVDGMRRRMQKFDPADFGLVILDESHHAVASSWRRMIRYYGRNPDLRVLGVTATPDRSDEVALGKIFDSVAFEMGLPEAIDEGWLVPIRQEFVQCTGLDFSHIGTVAGDLNEGELEQVMLEEKALHEVAGPTIEISGDRPTLVFATSVAHAGLIADIINRHNPQAAICLHGGTPREERRRLLSAYAAGKFQYLCGCALFLEGFDCPRVEVIAMARPTKSRALYAQAVGRGTRPIDPPDAETADERRAAIAASCKPACLVLDFVGNSGQHRLITTADILGGVYEDDVIQRAVENAKKSGGSIDMRDALQAVVRSDDEEKRRRDRLTARANFCRKTVDPFGVLGVRPSREAGWHQGKRPNDQSVRFLRAHGVDTREITVSKANDLEKEIKRRESSGLCSYRQAQVLAKWGYETNVSYDEAAAKIVQINGQLQNV